MLSGKWQPFCISLNMSSVFDAGGNWVAMDLSQSFPANEVLRIKIIADEIRKYNVKVQLKETGKWDLLGELIFLNDGGYIEKHSSFSWNSAAVGGVGRLGWGGGGGWGGGYPLCWSHYDVLLNSSPPSAAYMGQWTASALVQIMASTYSVPSHYLNQCWVIVNWTLRSKLQWNINQNTNIFIQENASKNIVCETAAILSTGRWVKEWVTIGGSWVPTYGYPFDNFLRNGSHIPLFSLQLECK